MAGRFDIHTTDFGWNRVGPIVRLLAWLGVIALAGVIAQAIVWAAGGEVSMLSPKGGRTVLLLACLASGALIMSRSGRSLADYGLAVSDRWRLHLLTGLAVGVGLSAGMIGLAAATGAAWTGKAFDAQGVWGGLAEALPAIPIASICVVMLCGFVVGELRLGHGRVASALLAAALAGLMFGASTLEEGLEGREARAALTAALAALVLIEMRLLTGDIVLPLGAAMGGLAVERFARKASLLASTDGNAWSAWLAPQGNPRIAPLLWVILLIAAVVLAVLIARRPARAAAQREHKGLSRSFKRTYPMGTMGALAPLDVWLVQLARARFRVGAAYIPRLIATLVLSTLNTILSLPERLILPHVYRRVQVTPPVFVLGVHRSGTTHLQNLLSLDRALITPRAHQVMNPWGFRFSGYLWWPILIIGTPWKRPMDAVRFGLSSANEEEYAIANLGGLSPDWSVRLPALWDEYDRFADPARFTDAERTRWKADYLGFLQRLVGRSGRRPMLKNPYNTGRVALLREMFPEAKFIHIHRHPFDTYRSNQHMAAEAHCLFELQEGIDRERFSRWFLQSYRAAEERYEADTANLPADQVVEVAFEALEQDALGEVQRVYRTLGLEYTDAFDAAIRHYLAGLSGYRKNVHKTLPEDERAAVLAAMGPRMTRWGYEGNQEAQETRKSQE